MPLRYFRLFSLAVLLAVLTPVPTAVAQGNGFGSNGFGPSIHGVPPSVTSFGFGGSRGFHGMPASVTSLGFGDSPFRINQRPFGFRRPHHGPFLFSPFSSGFIAVPYAYPVYVMDAGVDDSMEEDDYRGGPTIFDRRGSGERDYFRARQRAREQERLDQERLDQQRLDQENDRSAEPAKQQEVAEQPRTVLVFKDGHALEVMNYAIVGATLYDLSDGRARRVALAELDLPATVKQNDSRGVDFRVPVSIAVN